MSREKVTNAWVTELQEEGYEHRCETRHDLHRAARLGGAWRRILNHTRVAPPEPIFELGCGGGLHLAALALRGYVVHGIDVSPDVVNRAQRYLDQVHRQRAIQATVEVADIFEYRDDTRYSLTFHFGVVEHFLDKADRAAIWDKLASFTRPGGWVVSVVPCGQHPMRPRMRADGLGGYRIPEIDYSIESHVGEFEQAGLTSIHAIPHAYGSFLSTHPSFILGRVLSRPMMLAASLVLPWLPLPLSVLERAAGTLIVMGRRP